MSYAYAPLVERKKKKKEKKKRGTLKYTRLALQSFACGVFFICPNI
jgi:hypothetical protein